jgi:hypothetical protein
MSFFGSFFSKRVDFNAATVKIDQQVYLLNYTKHYGDLLQGHLSPQVISELFLFRAWTAQFGFRIFCSNPSASEKLTGETVNSVKYLGLGIFEQTHGFSVEDTLGSDFMSLIEDRWGELDCVIVSSKHDGSTSWLPTMKIIGVLMRRLGIANPIVTYQLSIDFLSQLDFIKQTALATGLLHAQSSKYED